MKSTTRTLPFMLLLIAAILFLIIDVHAQGWQWARGNTGVGMDGWPIATDNSGHIFVAGITFGGGSATLSGITIPNIGAGVQTIVAKYDSSGGIIWAKGTQRGRSYPVNIATDAFGNVILLGMAYDTILEADTFKLYFPSGSISNASYFLVKFDVAGNVVWVKKAGASSLAFSGFNSFNFLSFGGIATDDTGNIFIAGNYNSTSNTIGSFTVDNNDPSGLTNDVFIAKFDTNGSVKWVTNFGGNSNDIALSLTVSAIGNIYITGSFFSQNIGAGSSVLLNPYTNQLAYIAEINQGGAITWGEAAGGSAGAVGVGLAKDTYGNVYLTGGFADASIKFDTAVIHRRYPMPSSAQHFTSLFLVQYSPLHRVTWPKEISSPSTSVCGYCIALASCGQVWVSGSWGYTSVSSIFFDDSINVDGHIFYTPDSSSDPVFIAGYDLTGGVVGGSALQSGADDQNGIACDPNGNVYICADYYSSTFTNFIVGPDTLPKLAGTEYLYLAKYKNVVVSSHDSTHMHINESLCTGTEYALHAPFGYGPPFTWNTGATTFSIIADTPGTYWVSCFSKCTGTYLIDTIYLTVIPSNITIRTTDKAICQGDSIMLLTDTSSFSYLWNDNSANATLAVTNPGTYWVISDLGSCRLIIDTFYLSYVHCECFSSIPNAFTPNNDGKNDGFKAIIQPGCPFSDYTLSVFDRWGELVFNTHDPDARWYGEYRGIPMEIGTYMYYVSYTNDWNKKKIFYKGDVTLIR